MLKKSKYYTNEPSRPPLGKDAYELAKEWNCTPEEAAKRAKKEMRFTGYNDYGQETWNEE